MGQNLISDCALTMQMLADGDVEGAVHLSGETLARADQLWTVAFNNHVDTEPSLDAMLRAAFAHIHALANAGETVQAFSTCMLVLYQSAIDRSQSGRLTRGRLIQWNMGLGLFQELINNLNPADDEIVNHIRAIICYMSSMLYAVYRKAVADGISGPMVDEAFMMLSSLKGVIQSPSIDVNGTAVDPQADPATVMADLTGRLRAIGLLVV